MLLDTHTLAWSLLWAAGSTLLATASSLRDGSSEDKSSASSGVGVDKPLVKPRQIIDTINFNPNGSAYLWLPSEDQYVGKTFFE